MCEGSTERTEIVVLGAVSSGVAGWGTILSMLRMFTLKDEQLP